MDTDVEGSLNKFVCLLYGDTISQNVDECRYNLFKAGKCSDEALPPNTECLKNHIARTNYQAASWNGCLTSILLLPSPVGNGWELDGDQQLKVLWMTSPSAPESVLEFVQCRCKGGCKTQRYSCLKSGALRCARAHSAVILPQPTVRNQMMTMTTMKMMMKICLIQKNR
ncbi:uncharacterized protein LOC110235041 [Exaiptasia diaphana]|uniref:Uncharacterized protein n=1 Tax=Exaiptasia diaphana TaxID=2652724 RepID=A0A913WYW3_EXADI|nr:uncharacterized protein LOC110235041 [Exaiptasia diaphana]